MATARDVAREAGTSTAVVSYVFNNGPRNVSEPTRLRVLAAAEKLNYRPNALARALSAGRTLSLGLIVPSIQNPFFGELAAAIELAARRRGHLTLIGDSAMNPEQELLHIESFVERRVDGIVIVSALDEPDFSAMTDAGIPVVALHPIDGVEGVSSLTIDYAAAAEMAAGHLLLHRPESIGLLNGSPDSHGAQQHRAGFARALTKHDTPIRSDERWCGISRGEASNAALAWLAEADRPQALYCVTDEQAVGVLFAAHRLGLKVPGDLAVVGFDGSSHGAYSIPSLTTMKQPIGELANRAIEVLLDGGQDVWVNELLPFELVVRESCGCASAT